MAVLDDVSPRLHGPRSAPEVAATAIRDLLYGLSRVAWRELPAEAPAGRGDPGGRILPPMRFSPFEVTVAVVVVGTSAVFVGSTLDRPTPPTFRVTEGRFSEAGETLVGPRRYTVDARDPEAWVHFDFSRGAVVPPTDDLAWDLAFNRSNVIANGGEGFAGSAGIVDLGAVSFDSVRQVPASGYVATTASRDSVNEALADWYDYSFTSHLLLPKPRVYAVRTADGRFAKVRFLGYYCEGVIAGCMTFEYVYQGAGGRTVAPDGHRP